MALQFIARNCRCFPRLRRGLTVGLLLGTILTWWPSAGCAQSAAEPKSPPEAAATSSTAKADAKVAKFRVLGSVSRESQLLLAPSPTTFAAVGTDVLGLEDGVKAGTIGPKPKDAHVRRALSPDGRYFAFQNEVDHVMFVEIRDCKTGRKAAEFHYSTKAFQRIELLRFVTHGHLIVVAPSKKKMGAFVLNAEDGQKLKELTIDRADADKLGVTDNGRYLAVADTKGLIVYDLVRGKAVAQMAVPPNAVSDFLFVRALSFSPDNTELAGLFSGKGFRLVVWDQKGQVKEDYDLGLRIGGAYNEGDPIVWSPDGQGWLLHGNYYFDRRVKSIAWVLPRPPGHDYHHSWIDNDHVLATQGDLTNHQLVAVPVPRREIDAAAKVLESDEPALLRPGHKISLDVQVGETRFSDRASTVTALTDVLTKRFAENDIGVTPSQKTVLHVKYSEAAGAELRVTQGIGLRAPDTGQRVQETVIVFEAKLVGPDSPKPLWEKTIRHGNPHIVRSQTVNDAEVRNATFQMLEYVLSADPIPYFIPAKGDAPQLPIITKLSTEPGS